MKNIITLNSLVYYINEEYERLNADTNINNVPEPIEEKEGVQEAIMNKKKQP